MAEKKPELNIENDVLNSSVIDTGSWQQELDSKSVIEPNDKALGPEDTVKGLGKDASETKIESSKNPENKVEQKSEPVKPAEPKTEQEILIDPKNPEVKESDPKEILKTLIEDRKEIINEFNKEEDPKKKEELKEKKKELSDIIIRSASRVLDRDINAGIEQDMERDWPIFLAAKGFESEEVYNKKFRERESNKLIEQSNLSKSQKEKLSQGEEILIARSFWAGNLKFSKDQVLAALAKGVDLTKIKCKQWSEKIIVNGKPFDNEDELFRPDNHEPDSLADGIEKFNKGVLAKMDQEKQESFQERRDAFVEHKIQQIAQELKEEKKESPKEDIVEKKESPKSPEEEAKGKLKSLNIIRVAWDRAEKIDKALKEGRTVRDLKGRIFDPTNKEDKEKLIRAKGILSNRIMKLAGELYGSDLQYEYEISTGQNLEEHNKVDYQKWLTNKVREIYKQQIEEVEKNSGQKVVVKKNREEIQEVAAPDHVPGFESQENVIMADFPSEEKLKKSLEELENSSTEAENLTEEKTDTAGSKKRKRKETKKQNDELGDSNDDEISGRKKIVKARQKAKLKQRKDQKNSPE